MRSNVPDPPYTPGWSQPLPGNPYVPPVRPKRRTFTVVAGVAAVALAACFLGLFFFGAVTAHNAADPSSLATMEPPASSGGVRSAAAVLRQGDHLDVRAGTYVTTAPADGLGCVWQRVKRMDHELSSVIASDIVPAGADGIMVIKSSDAGVTLSGDCVWRRK